MFKILFSLLILILFFSLSACSPQYKLVYDYNPPEHEKGMQCINRQCIKNQNTCQLNCNSTYKGCLSNQEIAARENYPILLDTYYHEMELYESDLYLYHEKLNSYQLKKELVALKIDTALKYCNKRHIENKHCSDYHFNKKRLKKIPRPYRPTQPGKPLLVSSIRAFQKLCSKDCQCNNLFNLCYIGCGGQVDSRRLCTKNCNK